MKAQAGGNLSLLLPDLSVVEVWKQTKGSMTKNAGRKI